jgi:hypothetical protein
LRLNIPKAAQKKRKNMRNEMIPSDLWAVFVTVQWDTGVIQNGLKSKIKRRRIQILRLEL